ncbi:uncharacterized protein N7458_002671 [Penicillium daleae]|uniref:Uncharacterized protein n=1 Tax=Penicillium daleae TaxID=63821 RepID=A0AAD6CDX3_9EURO|nr:uncharacterized protein N7458_002671 [Penicillium daleae]KAJ5461119.1 hypothetical protein N7458_002671 [Penicillium daleae]
MSSSYKTKLDRKLNSYTPLEPTDKTRDFLRDFFEVLPPDGRQNLAEEVSECADKKLRQLFQSIRTGLLIPLKAQGGKTPAELTPEEPSGYLKCLDTSSQSQLPHNFLERDGNKCVATGHYRHRHAPPPNAMTNYIEAAHIILGSKIKARCGRGSERQRCKHLG